MTSSWKHNKGIVGIIRASTSDKVLTVYMHILSANEKKVSVLIAMKSISVYCFKKRWIKHLDSAQIKWGSDSKSNKPNASLKVYLNLLVCFQYSGFYQYLVLFLLSYRIPNTFLQTRGPFQWPHIERDGVSNHWRLDCLLIRLFRLRSQKTSKAVGYWPLWVESTGDRWIPLTKGQ